MAFLLLLGSDWHRAVGIRPHDASMYCAQRALTMVMHRQIAESVPTPTTSKIAPAGGSSLESSQLMCTSAAKRKTQIAESVPTQFMIESPSVSQSISGWINEYQNIEWHIE